MRGNRIMLFILLLALADRLTKSIAINGKIVLPWWHFSINSESAFSLAINQGILVVIMAAIVLGLIVYLVRHYSVLTVQARFAMWAIIAGAVSNIYDRVVYGGVIDFIDIGLWSVFNIADLYIVVGVVTILIFLRVDNGK